MGISLKNASPAQVEISLANRPEMLAVQPLIELVDKKKSRASERKINMKTYAKK
jgi:hypothetical protein